MAGYDDGRWPAYVPTAERRRRAEQRIKQLKKRGRQITPIKVIGRKLATTFWGEAWCKNLESYSDYSNRLPRGRTLVRNGSVIDLQVEPGRLNALVQGSELYTVQIRIEPVPSGVWSELKAECAGQLGSLVELLQGAVSGRVMGIVSRKGSGLFPAPADIALSCSCPDWAAMCKHVAAALYGVGTRLDDAPELLFTLRGVDPTELVKVAVERPVGAIGDNRRGKRAGGGQVLASSELSSIFGVDIEGASGTSEPTPPKRPPSGRGRKRAAVGASATEPAPATKAGGVKREQASQGAAKSGAAKKRVMKQASAKKRTQEAMAGKKRAPKKRATKHTAGRHERADREVGGGQAASRSVEKQLAAKQRAATKSDETKAVQGRKRKKSTK